MKVLVDTEDALQVAAAIHAGVDAIVTRNTAHFAAAPISVKSPATFLASAPA